jgi:hypothetical protein
MNGPLTISTDNKIYGTIQKLTRNSASYDKTKAAVYEIPPVSYEINGYVFRLLDGGIILHGTALGGRECRVL